MELQTPHKQKEMRRNCHRKILEENMKCKYFLVVNMDFTVVFMDTAASAYMGTKPGIGLPASRLRLVTRSEDIVEDRHSPSITKKL